MRCSKLLGAPAEQLGQARAHPARGGLESPDARRRAQTYSTDTPAGSHRSRRCDCPWRRAAPRESSLAVRSSGRRCSGAHRADRARRSPRSGRRGCRPCSCRNAHSPARRAAAADRCRSRRGKTRSRHRAQSDWCACRSSRGRHCAPAPSPAPARCRRRRDSHAARRGGHCFGQCLQRLAHAPCDSHGRAHSARRSRLSARPQHRLRRAALRARE